MSEISTKLSLPIPGANTSSKRLLDIQAVKQALIGFDDIVGSIRDTVLALDASGNAATATKLATARLINGVAFDGTADIVVNAVDTTARIAESDKGVANGVATLSGDGTIPANQLPSYVDDVLEFANQAALPVTGSSGKIYVTTDNNKTYRWTGTVYIEISATAGTADAATRLATARSINGVAFDGTADITITAAVSSWAGSPWDITGSCFGVPASSQVDIRFTAARAFVLPLNLTGSIASSGTAATASSVWNIQKNGVTVATATFAAGSTTGTLSVQAAINFAIGDKFRIIAPATVDPTLADVDFTLMATLA